MVDKLLHRIFDQAFDRRFDRTFDWNLPVVACPQECRVVPSVIGILLDRPAPLLAHQAEHSLGRRMELLFELVEPIEHELGQRQPQFVFAMLGLNLQNIP